VPRPPAFRVTLAAFSIPGYGALWTSTAASAFGWTASLVAIGWVVLDISDSPFAVGGTFAARLAPALVLGIPLGALVDRFDRRRTLIVVNVAGAAAALLVAAIAAAGRLGLAEIVALSVGLGVLDTLRGTAGQSYAYDLSGAAGATNAIALANLGGQLAGTFGGATGGVVLQNFGVAATFAMTALPGLVAAILLSLSRGRRTPPERAPTRLVPSLGRSMTLIARNRLVALIAAVVIVGEVLGFSSFTLYPTFARDVLHVDAAGLGAMSAARGVGGILGLILLARFGFGGRGGALLLGATVAFGLALVAFAASSVFALSLAILAFVGLTASALDTLGQSLVQQSVDDDERGAAMGIWFFAIGFGPFGHLGIGALAGAIGGPLALTVTGGLLAALGIAFALASPLRRLGRSAPTDHHLRS
jgi:MFS family permease